MSKYLEFNQLDVQRKTKVFEIRNKSDVFLGCIDWSGAWRQYVFTPSRACELKFSKGCLTDISKFIDGLMIEWRKK